MPVRVLPPHPSLDQLKRQAHELHRAHRDRDASAAARIAAHHPELRARSLDAVQNGAMALTDAQLVIAREYGFPSWRALKQHVETVDVVRGLAPHPHFDEALAALDAGDVRKLRAMLTADPSLAHARARLDPPYDYFTGATLLHHVAGNPDRTRPLPSIIADLARALLDAGADVQATTLGPDGGTVMGLLTTSKRASDQGFSGPLMDLLLERGAALDLHSDDALHVALANDALRAAERMLELGARIDVIIAGALGRMDLIEAAFGADGRLLARSRRGGVELPERDAIGLALLFAYVRHQERAVDFLLERDGNWNVTGVGNGTVLHRAAWNGDLRMVQRLVERGTDLSVRDASFGSTPLGWADYNGQREVFEWMRAHCRIDLHDAVAFGFREQVEARLREAPTAVDVRRDQWDLPQATALHCAARTKRTDIAQLLLEHGADPNALAGNGLTPLDVADFAGARGVVRLLEQRGGRRTPDADRSSGHPQLKTFEKLASDLLDAYRTGAEAALERLRAFFRARVTLPDLRRAVRLRLQKDGGTAGDKAPSEITASEARDVVAGARGFGSWSELAASIIGTGRTWNRPAYTIDRSESRLVIGRLLEDAEWDAVLQVMSDERLERLDAGGQMTDAVMARVSELTTISALQLGGSRRLTDIGLRHLPKLTGLKWLNLSGCGFTNAGLSVLRDLPALETFELHWHRGVTDEGIAHLADCGQLERVDVMGSPVGDGLLAAMRGKARLCHLKTGTRVTDAGLPHLHAIPRFSGWHGGEPRYSLMEAEAGPTHLTLDGPFTDRGLAALRGLDGVFGLSFFWHARAFTSGGLAVLASLSNLGFVGCEGERCTDEAMPSLAAVPGLRMLQAQGTVATDTGFDALARSATLEYLWGRDCPNLGGRGFAALSQMPSLRGLGVTLKRVGADVARLPDFPALRELMPMDASDDDFQHIGGCGQLERLWCMYCRDTTDAATEHIASLPALRTYYAGQTRITDRTLEMLSAMTTLESLEFWNCADITTDGAARLASLPRLQEVAFDNCRHVAPEVVSLFPRHVRVRHTI
jgi:ankyrin repeat protein